MLLNAVLAGLIILLLGIAAFAKWRWGVITVFVWLYVEDIIRRLLPGQPFEVTFIKDFLVWATYFSFFSAMVFKPRMKIVFQRINFIPALLLFIFVGILSSTYTLAPSLWAIGPGLHSYFWYVPFALIGYFMFRSEAAYCRFVRLLVYTSIPLTIIAIFQLVFYEKIEFALMRPFEVGDPLHSFLSTSIPFISSVFGSHGRYARFSLLLFFLSLGLLATRSNKYLLMIGIVFSAAGVFLSGQRAPMYLLIIGVLGYGIMMIIGRRNFVRLDANLIRIAIMGMSLLVMIAVVIFVWFPYLGDYFLHFTSVIERFAELIPLDIAVGFRSVGLYGMGFGAASQGIHFVAAYFPLETFVGVESGFGKVWYESGLPGMIVFVIFNLSIIYYATKRILKQPIVSRKGMSAAVVIFFVSVLFEFLFLHHQVLGDATTLIPLWFFIGVVLGMGKWPKEELKSMEAL